MDAYSKYEELIEAYRQKHGEDGTWENFYDAAGFPQLDYELLRLLVTKSIADGDSARSGGLARGLDMWIAEQLRRAGFEKEEIWPRLHEPRAIDPAIVSFVENLPAKLSTQCRKQLFKGGTANANVQGAVYQKQIDVGMSSWLAGPELLISTKTMSGSFGKNLANRFEEAYGDAMNLRKRFPLAAIGFFFLVNADIQRSPSDFSKAVAMLRKLQEEEGGYDACALLLVDWSGNEIKVLDESDAVPRALGVPRFFQRLIDLLLLRGPMGAHEEAALKAHATRVDF